MGKIAVKNPDMQKVYLDIANWISREPYVTFLEIEKKIGRRLQRKYKIKIDSKIIEQKISNFREIYKIIKENLSKYILPSQSGYAESQYIKHEEMKKFLAQRFPSEHEKILEIIADWVVYHEYLR